MINSLDPDQTRQNVRSDLGPNSLTQGASQFRPRSENSEIWGWGHLSPVPRLWGWTILYLLTGRDDMGQNPLIMSCGTDHLKQVSKKENKKTFQ